MVPTIFIFNGTYISPSKFMHQFLHHNLFSLNSFLCLCFFIPTQENLMALIKPFLFLCLGWVPTYPLKGWFLGIFSFYTFFFSIMMVINHDSRDMDSSIVRKNVGNGASSYVEKWKMSIGYYLFHVSSLLHMSIHGMSS